MDKFWGGNCYGTGNRDGTWADRNEFLLSASPTMLQQHTAAADSYLVGPELGGRVTRYQQLTQTFGPACSLDAPGHGRCALISTDPSPPFASLNWAQQGSAPASTPDQFPLPSLCQRPPSTGLSEPGACVCSGKAKIHISA